MSDNGRGFELYKGHEPIYLLSICQLILSWKLMKLNIISEFEQTMPVNLV